MPAGMFYRAPIPSGKRKKKLPMPHNKVDQAQNKKIEYLEKRIVKMQLEEELKFKDTSINTEMLSNASAGATTGIILLNGISQGDTRITRDGDLARITSVQMKVEIRKNILELSFVSYRIMLVWDKQSNGAAPTLANVIDGSVISTVTHRPYQLDNVPNRFKILYDKSFTLNHGAISSTDLVTGAVTAYAPQTKVIHVKIPVNKKTNYGLANAGDITDISTGSLYLYALSTEASGATPATLLGGTRVYFKDA